MCVQLSRLFIFVCWFWKWWTCCRTWDTFHRRTISRVFLLIQGSSDFPTASLLWLCGNMLSHVWTERLSTGFITLPSLNKPQRCVNPPPPPPFAAAVFLSLSGIDSLRLPLREYCMSRNQWWSNARHAAGAQFIVVALLNTLIYEVDIYLPHVQWRVHAHTHGEEWADEPFLPILSIYGHLVMERDSFLWNICAHYDL